MTPSRRQRLARAVQTVSVTFLIALVLTFTIELVARGSAGGALGFFLQPYRPGWTTVVIFCLLFLGLDALLGRAHQGLLVLAPVFMVLAFTGHQKAYYLGDPLYPTDFLYARQIVELMPLLVADRPWTAVGLVLSMVVASAALFFAWRFWRRKFPRLSKGDRIIRLAVALPALAFFVSIMDYATFSWARDRLQIFPIMWDQKENYAHNGFALAFALNVPMAKVSAPSGYSQAAIAAAPQPATAASVPLDRPDIIVVMSESFWDPSRLPGTMITPDPIANARRLQSGHVFSPEFGGMTANVEFEALTGFSNAFLPYGSIPYQQYVRDSLPSMATFLKSQGYDTLAIHPFEGWFWNRKPVYKAFGFTDFLSSETLPPMAKRGQLVSDAALTDEIIREAEAKTDPFFIFAVSLQSHGPYEPNRYAAATHTVSTIGGPWARGSILTYAEGASDADKGLEQLIEWASNRDRPTVIAFFGDHLPPLGPAYVDTGFLKNPVPDRKESAEKMALHRETPLVVWSNRAGSAETGSISPAFLPLEIFKAAGIQHPYYTDFLGKVREQYRVVERSMLIGADDAATPEWSRAKSVAPIIRDFRFLQFDIMFGKRHGAPTYFPETLPADQRPPDAITRHYGDRIVG
ncbi:LTA synthase family protein [Arvimicrobium flavum]|uniref:LTA synthase family protein n=1 Tax=Arvimicrobium flavum TaxID=3393320 RepID=UPI00237B5667|nr:LTA synthase family protein [Mesorhizobium shangrilense]